MKNTALVVIDIQNDYFPEGKFPLWNTQATLEKVMQAIDLAKAQSMPVILVQHLSESSSFFAEGSHGFELHPEIEKRSADTKRVIKRFADTFEKTNLDALLQDKQQEHPLDTLLICGMMTQNCVVHTAISKAAEKYQVSILQDACTTVDENIHAFAIDAVSTRLTITTVEKAFE